MHQAGGEPSCSPTDGLVIQRRSCSRPVRRARASVSADRGGPLLQHDVDQACLPAGAPTDRPGAQDLGKRHDQQNGSAEVGDNHHDEER